LTPRCVRLDGCCIGCWLSRSIDAIQEHIMIIRHLAVAALIAVAAPAFSQTAEDAIKDVQATLGTVPGFIKTYPKAALPGAWAQVKALEFADNTAIPSKYKALLSLAVSAQIPCHYCIWLDTSQARRAGASDAEIAEAVTLSGMSRHWSTIFNGMQIDFATFKKELGGDAAAK
jgi:AhpD family alkylhydroperoxidase